MSDEFKPVLLAYAGERYGKKRCATYYIVEKGKPVGEGLWYQWTAKRARRSIGSIYEGASMSGTTMKGLDGTLRYKGTISDVGLIATWEAEELAARMYLEQLKEEKGTRVPVIETLLLPLRIEHEKHYEKFDRAKMLMLEQAVLSALRTKPRQSEL